MFLVLFTESKTLVLVLNSISIWKLHKMHLQIKKYAILFCKTTTRTLNRGFWVTKKTILKWIPISVCCTYAKFCFWFNTYTYEWRNFKSKWYTSNCQRNFWPRYCCFYCPGRCGRKEISEYWYHGYCQGDISKQRDQGKNVRSPYQKQRSQNQKHHENPNLYILINW